MDGGVITLTGSAHYRINGDLMHSYQALPWK